MPSLWSIALAIVLAIVGCRGDTNKHDPQATAGAKVQNSTKADPTAHNTPPNPGADQPSSASPPHEELVAKLQALKDSACQCKSDTACATEALKAYAEFFRLHMGTPGSDAAAKRMSEPANAAAQCFLAAGLTAIQIRDALENPIKKLKNAEKTACDCGTDRACATRVLAIVGGFLPTFLSARMTKKEAIVVDVTAKRTIKCLTKAGIPKAEVIRSFTPAGK